MIKILHYFLEKRVHKKLLAEISQNYDSDVSFINNASSLQLCQKAIKDGENLQSLKLQALHTTDEFRLVRIKEKIKNTENILSQIESKINTTFKAVSY